MKLTVNKPVEIEVCAIRCVVEVRYDEEDMPNDYPFRENDCWDVTIDIDSGQIRGWPGGHALDLYMKITDCGCYYLLDASGNVVASRKNDYVPSCIPGQYGDYIDFKIDGGGRIVNWSPQNFERKVVGSFFRDDDD